MAYCIEPFWTFEVVHKQFLIVTTIIEPAVAPLHFEKFHIFIHLTVIAPELSLQFNIVPGYIINKIFLNPKN
jgi:hypothetical protein